MNNIVDNLIERYPALKVCEEDIYTAFKLICGCFEGGGKLLVCGNGGSAADADHIVGELMKGFLKKRELSCEDKKKFGEGLQYGLPAVSLCAHGALISAFANDVDPLNVYAQQVFAYSRSSRADALLSLTTSGNSENVVRAAAAARAAGIASVAITGKAQSRISEIADVCIRLPESETYKVQELMLPVYHALCAMLEEKFYNF